MMITASQQDWIILFGGADRENIVIMLFNMGVAIKSIIVPSLQSNRLKASIDKIRYMNVPIIQVDKKQIDSSLQIWEGCALLSIGFPYLLSADILKRHSLRLNVHPTLLPKYRGPTTGAYILINGEKFSGSTVHILDTEMDKGDIIVQSKVEISKFDTVRSLQRKVYASEPELIKLAFRHLDANLPLIIQDEKTSSTFPRKRKPEDSLIDPQKSVLELFDFIRACDPEEYPAFFYVDGQKVCIKLWRPERTLEDFDTI
jgi:methionyl-tRNA formyltransferase